MARSICFYFQVHQPYRLGRASLLRPDDGRDYFQGEAPFTNREVFEKVAEKCYLPMTALLLEMLAEYPDFRASFSLSGVFVEQCQEFGAVGKKVLKQFQTLAQNDRIEFLGETYYHSLSFLHSKAEWAEQILQHHKLMEQVFGVKPRVFRHTELIYSNELASAVCALGYDGIVAEGWHTALPDQNPNYVRYAKLIDLPKDDVKILRKVAFRDWTGLRAKKQVQLPVLTKNYQLSDDMAFRFGDRNWSHYPLHADTYAQWLAEADGDTVNLFMDFETFGEHQWADTEIFSFFRALPAEVAKRGLTFRTPGETVRDFEPRGEYDAPHWVSWADEARDISAWLENDMQRSAFHELMEMEKQLYNARRSRSNVAQKLVHDFRKLQTSDHLYYMSTKYWADGDVHTYFSPYASPYDAYINFMNVMGSLKRRMERLK